MEIHRLTPNDQQIDRKSIEYWEKTKQENEKLLSNMTDEQRKMLTDIENKFSSVSKFVDE